MMGTYNYYIERIEKFLSPTYWSDINIHSGIFGDSVGPTKLVVYEPTGQSRPLVSEVLQLLPITKYFRDTQVGAAFGPSWSTKWFRVTFAVPMKFAGKRIALRWDSDSEAMLYLANELHDGGKESSRYLQSFTGGGGNDRRDLYIIPDIGVAGQTLEFLVEMACNGMFGNGNNGMIRPPDPTRMFTLAKCELTEVREVAMGLFWDMKVLYELAKAVPESSPVGTYVRTVASSISSEEKKFVDIIFELQKHKKS
jgi:alpha-mannosidase